MKHNKKIVLGGVALTKARSNRYESEAAKQVMSEVETWIKNSHVLDTAPFTWFGIVLRFGTTNEDAPHYRGIDKKDGELALAIEVDACDFAVADRKTVKELFLIATLKAVIHAGRKYNLPTEELEKKLEKSEQTYDNLLTPRK